MSKSSSVRTRKRGKTWSYIFEAGKTAEGKRKVVEKGGYPTKQTAYDAGVAAYTDWKHGNIGITSEKVTVKDFMTNWLENVLALNVKQTSMQAYISLFDNHIVPSLGNITLQNLTPAVLDSWIRQLLKVGYSKSLISCVHALLHHSLDYAVYPAELIKSNPASYIKVPQKAPANIIQRHIITPEQLSTLLEKYPFGTAYYIPILILFHTGVRIGELLDLSWDDIDFDTKTITLQRQVAYLDNKRYCFTTLKNESSNRYIVMDDFLVAELKRWKVQQIENEKAAGGSYVYIYETAEGKLVQCSKTLGFNSGEKINSLCTHSNGRILIRALIVQTLRANGINVHSFRHTHVTTLIENGVTPKAVADRLGHSNASITQNLNADTLKTKIVKRVVNNEYYTEIFHV